MNNLQKEMKKLIGKCKIPSPKEHKEQVQRIMESGLFKLKPHRSGYLVVFKRKE